MPKCNWGQDLCYLAQSGLQFVDEIQEVPLLPGQLVVHLVMAVLGAGPQSPLVDLGLAGRQGALLGHDGLLQGPQGVVHLANLMNKSQIFYDSNIFCDTRSDRLKTNVKLQNIL